MQLDRNRFGTIHGTVVLAILISLLALSGCERQQQAAPPPSTPEVTTVTIQTQRVVLTTELPGRISSFRVAEIRPQVSGLILKRLFEEGSDVKEGQELYQIDPALFQAALNNSMANLAVARKAADQARAALAASKADVDKAKATLDLAKINRQRYETLFKNGDASTSQRDQAVTEAEVAAAALKAAEAQVVNAQEALAGTEAAIQQAKAQTETARINLDYTQIAAPISGRIGKSNVTEGAMTTAYQAVALATIQQIDPIYVDVTQSTTEIFRLRRLLEGGTLNQDGTAQQKIKLLLEDNMSYSEEGTLQFRDITVDPTTGSSILRIVFPNPHGILLPGMFARAILQEGINEQAILLPQQAVTRDPKGNPTVFLVDADNKVQQKTLTLDRAIGDKWLVSSGLASGDRVVLEGKQKVRGGNTVKIAAAEEISKNPTNPAISEQKTTESQTAPQPAAKTN